jgi:glycerate kinase
VKIVVAPDSFKGSLPASAVALAMARGVKAVLPSAEVVEIPVADGGEGTVEALVASTGGRFMAAEVDDPLGRPVSARYGFLGDAKTAVIEMAAASGLPLVPPGQRNPMKTSTFGTGQLILHAAGKGAAAMILGIGGSATVDGGTGMARALGIRLLDSAGRPLCGGGEILAEIARIDASGRAAVLDGVTFVVACDVTNPLTGPQGAAAVYGPQKGATPAQVAALEKGLANLARRIREDLGLDVESLGGAGAAGGLGAGMAAFLGARLESGIEIVLEAAGLRKHLQDAALVFTGEGKVDGQSAFGKAAAGVASAAREAGVPVILLAGAVGQGAETMHERGVSAILSIAGGPGSEEQMLADAPGLVERAAGESLRAFLAGRGGRLH